MLFNIYAVAACVVCLMGVIYGGIIVGLPLGIMFFVGIFWVWGWSQRLDAYLWEVQTLRQYAIQIDDVYEFSTSEKDTMVVSRAKQAEALIKKSGNSTGMKVHYWIFQEGEFCNESWEEFQQRVALSIKPLREERHKKMRAKYPEFYEKHALGQIF